MIITCKNCSTSFSLDDELVKDTGTKVRCSKCHHVFQTYPSHIQQETEFQGNKVIAESVEEEADFFRSFEQKENEEKFFPFEADGDDDLDLSEIDKLLREEEADLSAESGSYQRVDEQKDSDDFDFDFEFEDLDELLAEEDKSDLNPKTDPLISSLESFAEEIDLSELDDFFKEDETQVESFLEPDEDSKESIFEFDPELKNFLEPPEAEDVESSGKVEDIEEEIEDIDFSDLDNLFAEDESPPAEGSEIFQDNDSMSEKSEEFSDIDNLLDSEKELSLNDTSEKTDDQFDFELEIESQEDSEAEVARNKEAPDPDPELDLEFDLDLTMEDDFGFDPLAEKKDAETDFEFDLELDAEENTEAEGKTLDDEEFDLSDLENIIDLEEEPDNEVKPFKETKAAEMEDEELEFDLHLDPDDEKWTSPEVVFEKEDLELDNSDKIAALGSGPEDQGEENAHEFYAQKTLGASFEEKDDYDVEENRGKFQEAFETVTLISHPIQGQQEESVESKPEKKPKKRLSKTILVAFILFILAAAGYGAFTVFKPMNIQIPFIGNFMKDQPVDPGNLQMHISDLHSRFMDNQNGERIFIITGMVNNEYQEARSLVKITGKIYQSERQLTQSQQVYAGNTVSDLELFSLKPEVIKNRLNNRSGENRTNLNVQPNQSISFMIVFSNLPQNLEEFTVEIDGSSQV